MAASSVWSTATLRDARARLSLRQAVGVHQRVRAQRPLGRGGRARGARLSSDDSTTAPSSVSTSSRRCTSVSAPGGRGSGHPRGSAQGHAAWAAPASQLRVRSLLHPQHISSDAPRLALRTNNRAARFELERGRARSRAASCRTITSSGTTSAGRAGGFRFAGLFGRGCCSKAGASCTCAAPAACRGCAESPSTRGRGAPSAARAGA